MRKLITGSYQYYSMDRSHFHYVSRETHLKSVLSKSDEKFQLYNNCRYLVVEFKYNSNFNLDHNLRLS